jgi:hypothetical protein
MRIAPRWRFCGTAVLSVVIGTTGGNALARGRHDQNGHHDRGDRNHDRGHDRDRGRDQDRGRDHDRFDDHDREVSWGWYRAHRDHLPPGLRDRDRLPPGIEKRLIVGTVLDSGLRSRIHPCPDDLVRRLPPPPVHYRYVAIGGHIALIDGGYHVADVIHFELNF